MNIGKFISVFILLMAVCSKLIAAELTTTAFYSANKAYEQEDYDKAIQEYKKIADSGYESANLYYNLGNCYYKRGNYPQSILYYERAARLNPRDPDLRSNYEYVLSFINISYQPPAHVFILSWIKKIFGVWDINGLAVFFFTINILIFLLLALRLFFAPLKRYSPYLFVILGLVFLAGVYDFTIRLNRLGREAVIVSETADIKFEPNTAATTYFTIHGGEKVIVIVSKEDWVKVRRLDGKTGWVKKEELEVI